MVAEKCPFCQTGLFPVYVREHRFSIILLISIILLEDEIPSDLDCNLVVYNRFILSLVLITNNFFFVRRLVISFNDEIFEMISRTLKCVYFPSPNK